MRGLNLSSFKKIKEDKDSATMIHKDGHQLVIAKAPLPALQKKQLEKLPVHYAEGSGDVQPQDQLQIEPIDESAPEAQPPVQAGPEASPVQNSQPQPSPQQPVAPQSDAQNTIQAQVPGFEEEKSANLAAAKALDTQGSGEAAAYKTAVNQMAGLPTQNDIIAKNKKQSDDLFDAYKKKELDPDHYWQSHSKFASGIGVLLGSFGRGANGGSNSALDAINKGINRDIDAQKNSQDQKMNLWKMNKEALGNDLAANLATQNQLYTGLKYKIEQAAANAKGPIAIANAQAANAKIDQAIGMNNFKLSLMNPTSDNPDPASRVQFLVPPDRQKDVVNEINAAKNTVANAPGILEAFEMAVKDARPATGGLTGTSPKALIPGMKTAGQAALQARLGPTFQDIEGTVRQAAMDNLDHNVTPRLGDSDHDIAVKRQSLLDYMKSKSAAAASKSFGIDLSRFPGTNTRGIVGASQETLPTKGGIQYQKQIINGKSYMVPVK